MERVACPKATGGGNRTLSCPAKALDPIATPLQATEPSRKRGGEPNWGQNGLTPKTRDAGLVWALRSIYSSGLAWPLEKLARRQNCDVCHVARTLVRLVQLDGFIRIKSFCWCRLGA